MRRRLIFKRLRDAVESQGMDSATMKALSVDALRSMAAAEGESVTFIKNMRNKLVAELKKKERQVVAGWIESKIRERFPLAEVKLAEDKVAIVYLDGAGKEVEV